LAALTKQVQALESAAQATDEARQRRELETKAESTRLKTQLDGEIDRSKSLAKDLEAAQSRSAKASELATRESVLRKEKKDLEGREQRHAQSAAELDAKAKLLHQRDQELTRRETELGRLDSEAQAAEKAFRERERELVRLEKGVDDKSKALEARTLQGQRELKEKADSLEKQRADLESQSKELKRETEAVKSAREGLDRHRAELDRREANLHAEPTKSGGGDSARGEDARVGSIRSREPGRPCPKDGESPKGAGAGARNSNAGARGSPRDPGRRGQRVAVESSGVPEGDFGGREDEGTTR